LRWFADGERRIGVPSLVIEKDGDRRDRAAVEDGEA
jgi:hypothetical protein